MTVVRADGRTGKPLLQMKKPPAEGGWPIERCPVPFRKPDLGADGAATLLFPPSLAGE